MANETHFPDGFFGDYESGIGEAPNAPTITTSDSGRTVTVTFAGDEGVTNYLFYKKSAASDWTVGGNRAGDGDIAITGLDTGVRYLFVGYSYNAAGGNSQPSPVLEVTLASLHTSAFRTFQIVLAQEAITHLGAESITYYPGGGGSRAILGLIDREEAASLPGAPHGNAPGAVISVLNDSDSGISAPELDKNLDKIAYEVRIGETAQARKVVEIVEQDPGMLRLRVA